MIILPIERLRDENCPPPVDVEDIVKAIDGNLCRCTGYRPILEAFTTFCDDATKDVDKNASTTFDRSSFKEYCPEKDDPGLASNKNYHFYTMHMNKEISIFFSGNS